MSVLKSAANSLLYGSRLYGPARHVYRSLFNRAKLRVLKRARDLYGRFLGRGDLVLDVGANKGDYTDIFLDLGASVVALEPNPDCADRLRRRERKESLYVENVALGDFEGYAELHICSQNEWSTLSEEKKHAALTSDRLRHLRWERSIQVPVTTLDAIARRRGLPRFVKIDTEGYDDKVLQGMSFRPPALSFEVLPFLPNVALRALAILGEQYVYNYTVREEFELVLPSWLPLKEMGKTVQDMPSALGYGDILAKQRNL